MYHSYGTLVIIIFCILMSGFFSGSETAVTAVNRYRLQYLASIKKNPAAIILFAMLKKPQKLLGMILIANTFFNMMVSSLVTTITISALGQEYVLVATIALTLMVLIFAEVMPKSVAAHKPDTIAYRVARVLSWLLWLLSPLVAVVDAITSGILRLLGVHISQRKEVDLSRDELGNLIKQRAQSSDEREVEHMLEGILDLGDMTVEDVMLPRSEMDGIDISDTWENIIRYLKLTKRQYLLLFDENIDTILGYVDIHAVTRCLLDNKLSKDTLLKKMHKVCYVPESTKLEKQLTHFKERGESIAAIVDEYGQLSGIVEREDIIDEIVGEYALGYSRRLGPFVRYERNQYWFNGNTSIRDINKNLHWSLPDDSANTIGGLIVEWVECIPEGNFSVVIQDYKIEVLQMKHNKVHRLKIMPPEQVRNTQG